MSLPIDDRPVATAKHAWHAQWLAAAALSLCACGGGDSPAAQLRAVIAGAERAAEHRVASALFDLIAADYPDGDGNGAEEIKRYVRGYLITHQSIHMLTRVDKVEIKAAGLANVRATVGMLGREAAPESSWDLAADLYEFDLTLAREGGEWRVIRAAWRRAGAG